VLFDGKVTNLHHAWDTSMPEKLIGGYSLDLAQSWADALTTAIQSENGVYNKLATSWLTGLTLSDPVTSALIWATEANAFICTTVLLGGAEALQDQELSGDYYNAAIPVIQLQVARGGYRYVFLL
jgi:hypothetical protein